MTIKKPTNDDERNFVINCITNSKFLETYSSTINKKYFPSIYAKTVVPWCIDYFNKYGKAPNRDIQQIYNSKKLKSNDEETVDLLKKFLSSISKEYAESTETTDQFKIDQGAIFLKLQSLEILKNSISDSIVEKNPDKGEKALSNYRSITATKNDKSLFSRIGDMEIKSPDWLIEGLFQKDSTNVLFGDPATGKSFIALDMGASIASGIDFHCHGTKISGPVVYICGEGRATVGRRCRAWSIRNEVDLTKQPFFIINVPVQLNDPQSILLLQTSLKQIADTEGDPVLIIIDTWNRLSGIEENSNSDTAKVIAALDRLRAPYQAVVLIVHHSGHSEKGRARGASALNGALDTNYKVEKDEDTITMTNTKTKDGKAPEPMSFDLVDVDLQIIDEHGQAIESAALARCDYVKPQRTKRMGKNEDAALKFLLGKDRTPYKDWRLACINVMNPTAFCHAKNSLLIAKEISIEDDFVSPFRSSFSIERTKRNEIMGSFVITQNETKTKNEIKKVSSLKKQLQRSYNKKGA